MSRPPKPARPTLVASLDAGPLRFRLWRHERKPGRVAHWISGPGVRRVLVPQVLADQLLNALATADALATMEAWSKILAHAAPGEADSFELGGLPPAQADR